jgi:hypothetical protein
MWIPIYYWLILHPIPKFSFDELPTNLYSNMAIEHPPLKDDFPR